MKTLFLWMRWLGGHPRGRPVWLLKTSSAWQRDPLSHPDIRRMSERERADLQYLPDLVLRE